MLQLFQAYRFQHTSWHSIALKSHSITLECYRNNYLSCENKVGDSTLYEVISCITLQKWGAKLPKPPGSDAYVWRVLFVWLKIYNILKMQFSNHACDWNKSITMILYLYLVYVRLRDCICLVDPAISFLWPIL